ncbi:ArsC family reductase [Methylocaldum sp.]|uniref:ArsC family reductase n=1 Tax=Methylocaldum sp. TaxID=1969727 RepID=UPI002D2494FC|nr:ArsC family reductase [Methylocaldum sp.]HYE34398.1 ArsC family reductase [Methylocaldum sp.]
MLDLYGIRNCDTCKKARAWLELHDIAYHFHDFRDDGLDRSVLEEVERALGWECLLNRRSTTWRQLGDADRMELTREKALELMLRFPTLIKRPVLMASNTILTGFLPAQYEKAL